MLRRLGTSVGTGVSAGAGAFQNGLSSAIRKVTSKGFREVASKAGKVASETGSKLLIGAIRGAGPLEELIEYGTKKFIKYLDKKRLGKVLDKVVDEGADQASKKSGTAGFILANATTQSAARQARRKALLGDAMLPSGKVNKHLKKMLIDAMYDAQKKIGGKAFSNIADDFVDTALNKMMKKVTPPIRSDFGIGSKGSKAFAKAKRNFDENPFSKVTKSTDDITESLGEVLFKNKNNSKLNGLLNKLDDAGQKAVYRQFGDFISNQTKNKGVSFDQISNSLNQIKKSLGDSASLEDIINRAKLIGIKNPSSLNKGIHLSKLDNINKQINDLNDALKLPGTGKQPRLDTLDYITDNPVFSKITDDKYFDNILDQIKLIKTNKDIPFDDMPLSFIKKINALKEVAKGKGVQRSILQQLDDGLFGGFFSSRQARISKQNKTNNILTKSEELNNNSNRLFSSAVADNIANAVSKEIRDNISKQIEELEKAKSQLEELKGEYNSSQPEFESITTRLEEIEKNITIGNNKIDNIDNYSTIDNNLQPRATRCTRRRWLCSTNTTNTTRCRSTKNIRCRSTKTIRCR